MTLKKIHKKIGSIFDKGEKISPKLVSGFTLAEFMISAVVLILLILVLVNLQKDIFSFNAFNSEMLSSAYDAQSILKTMVKELRSTKEGSDGSYPLVQAATSSVTFFSDINNDGLVDEVNYFLSGKNLMKGVIVPAGSPLTYNPANEKFSTLASNVVNSTSTPLFNYYNDSYNGTTAPLTQPVTLTAVSLVQINLLIDADPRRAPLPRMYTSDATLRNLKDNL